MLKMISSGGIFVRKPNDATGYVEHESHDADMLSTIVLIFELTYSRRDF